MIEYVIIEGWNIPSDTNTHSHKKNGHWSYGPDPFFQLLSHFEVNSSFKVNVFRVVKRLSMRQLFVRDIYH